MEWKWLQTKPYLLLDLSLCFSTGTLPERLNPHMIGKLLNDMLRMKSNKQLSTSSDQLPYALVTSLVLCSARAPGHTVQLPHKNHGKTYTISRNIHTYYMYITTFKLFHTFQFVLVPPPTDFLTPKCSLPRNITGTWLTQGVQYRSDIRINDTHIYYFTPINEFEYQETYYSCQQSQGTRYLMTKVVVGRW